MSSQLQWPVTMPVRQPFCALVTPPCCSCSLAVAQPLSPTALCSSQRARQWTLSRTCCTWAGGRCLRPLPLQPQPLLLPPWQAPSTLLPALLQPGGWPLWRQWQSTPSQWHQPWMSSTLWQTCRWVQRRRMTGQSCWAGRQSSQQAQAQQQRLLVGAAALQPRRTGMQCWTGSGPLPSVAPCAQRPCCLAWGG